MHMKMGFLLLAILILSQECFSQSFGYEDNLFSGLDSCISETLPEDLHAFKISQINPETNLPSRPPISDDLSTHWLINKHKTPTDWAWLEETALYNDIFPNEEFVFLPTGAQILKTSVNESPYLWKYPEGMTFLHRIKFKKSESAQEQIFEIRVIKRVEGHWAFGVYAPSNNGPCQGRLELRRKPIAKEMEIKASRQREVVELRTKPLNPKSCLNCHGMGDAEKLNVGPSKIGPCNFNFIETLQKNLDHPLFATF